MSLRSGLISSGIWKNFSEDQNKFQKMFNGKTLLITGGTGSFGNAVLNRFLETDVSQIRIFSRDEKKQHDMREKYRNDKIKFYIGDVRDLESVRSAMTGVDYVFHAAALKQVPSCEFYPLEALKTNVLGASNVLDAAVTCGVARVICLSTDKAVYPINAMGLTKALMEKVVVAKSRTIEKGGPIFCLTRYGNVMASRGSVIPLFVRQILGGEEITITDPNMTRFLMSLEDSVDLVLYAYKHGRQGDLFVQKAPAATIQTLAEAISKILGKECRIRVIGTRHGEKVYESLVSREELSKVDDLDSYYRIPADNRDLNYSKYFIEGEESIAALEDYTSHNTTRLDVDGVVQVLTRIADLAQLKDV